MLNNIFTPYEKGVKGVFGLGLSIVRKTLHFLNYDITIENTDKHFFNGEKNYVVFDSISEDIYLPYDTGMEILNYINNMTDNKCFFEENSFFGPSKKEYSYTYLICRFGVDMSKVPNIKFVFEGFE